MDNEMLNQNEQEELDDDIVILEDEEGNAVTFQFLELVTVDAKPYAVLLPLDQAVMLIPPAELSATVTKPE